MARKNPSERYHNRVARQYDAIYDDPYWAFHDELTWRSIKPHLPRDANAACGRFDRPGRSPISGSHDSASMSVNKPS